MTIKAIETLYAGTTFRSRLEADYAATFDSIGMSWQYEPEGFELSDGTWYSPDFYLPNARAWCEVKGDHLERVSKVHQFAADLWEAAGQPNLDSPEAPCVVLATSPRRDFYDYDQPRFVGVRGPGKAYSIGLATCTNCQQTTFTAWSEYLCRSCGIRHDDSGEDVRRSWFWSICDHTLVKFVRLPRPAGRR